MIYSLQGTILDLILLVFVLKTIFRWCYFSTNILKMVEKLGTYLATMLVSNTCIILH